jgi:putative phage-type endonuclease
MEIIKDIEQGSPEWFALRYGWITASMFKAVISKGKGAAPSKTRLSYMYQVAAETVSEMRQESFTSEYMEWGTETEPHAREMYEFVSGNKVEEVTFIRLGDGHKIGCSPDGIIGDDGMIEIKCPKTTTQVETFLSGKMPTLHKAQVQGQLWVANRQWCDFVSFDPRINGDASYFCERIERDEDYIKELEAKCFSFETDLIEVVNKLKG